LFYSFSDEKLIRKVTAVLKISDIRIAAKAMKKKTTRQKRDQGRSREHLLQSNKDVRTNIFHNADTELYSHNELLLSEMPQKGSSLTSLQRQSVLKIFFGKIPFFSSKWP